MLYLSSSFIFKCCIKYHGPGIVYCIESWFVSVQSALCWFKNTFLHTKTFSLFMSVRYVNAWMWSVNACWIKAFWKWNAITACARDKWKPSCPGDAWPLNRTAVISFWLIFLRCTGNIITLALISAVYLRVWRDLFLLADVSLCCDVVNVIVCVRRESERRNHSLARHADILAAVETRLSLLNMTFMKYVDSSLCCFIPGKVPLHFYHKSHSEPWEEMI